MNKEAEIKVWVENVYCLGGSRGNDDQKYLDKVIARLIELTKTKNNE